MCVFHDCVSGKRMDRWVHVEFGLVVYVHYPLKAKSKVFSC